MADNGIADFVKQVTLANSALSGKFNKSMGGTLAKTTLLQKAFGPFLDSWIKIKSVVEMAVTPFTAILAPLQLVKKTSDGIKLTFLGLVGVFIAVAAGIAALTDKFGVNNEGTEKLKEALGGLRDTFQGILDKVQEVDFQQILDNGTEVFNGLLSLFGSVAAEIITWVDYVITTLLELPATLEDLGFLDTVRETFDEVFGAVQTLVDSVKNALTAFGGEGESVAEIVGNAFDKIGAALVEMGAVEAIEGIIDVLGEVIELVVNLLAVFIDLAVEIMETEAFGVFVDIIEGGIQLAFDAINGLLDFIGGVLGTINDLLSGDITLGEAFDQVAQHVEDAIQGVIDWLTNIDWMGIIGDGLGALGDLAGGALDLIGFSAGGIASGPTSGYPAMLHGTEAVVPLPDGRSIPVSLEGTGGGGGGNATFNINVSGGKGDPESIAKAVGKEVQRVFKSRSRSGGYGRGI
tara:strand:- start:4205 stop:5590 length:1386 start_codon:yes stop_codon:yes gene_type:complete